LARSAVFDGKILINKSDNSAGWKHRELFEGTYIYLYIIYFNRISYALKPMYSYIGTFRYLVISACNIPSVFCAAPPEDEQVML
jgi:hypothetical protein